MSSKISELSTETLGVNDFAPISRGGANYKVNLSEIISSYLIANSSISGNTTDGGKLAQYGTFGILRASSFATTNGGWFIIGGATNVGNIQEHPTDPFTETRDFYLPNENGTIATREYFQNNVTSSPGYAYNTGAYVYNTGNLVLSNSYNGKVIVSNNTTNISYTIASGLISGFSCQVIQNNTGIITFTGAAGTSMNSYGGLTQIAGRYGSAAIQWTAGDTYVIAGNLS